MKNLPPNIRKNGFNYTLVLRGKRSLIFQQEVSPNLERYEVFLIKVKPERVVSGKIIPEKEVFPGKEDIGKWGWVYNDLNSAMWRFSELEQGLKMKQFTWPDTDKNKYG